MPISGITGFTSIPNDSDATPGLWNTRFQQLQDNINSVWTSANSYLGNPLSSNTIRPDSGNTVSVVTSTALVSRSIDSGGWVFNAVAFGLVGDANDSRATTNVAAINSAISAANAIGGGVVVIPSAGTHYAVIAGSDQQNIALMDRVELRLEQGAVLKQIQNNNTGYQIIRATNVSDVAVVGGGMIQGDRDSHGTTLGEAGMGISFKGVNRGRIEGVIVRDCWGDGILVDSNSTDVHVRNVRLTRNRRNNISITGVTGGSLTDSFISGAQGTSPQAGIDLEPDSYGAVQGFVVANNHVSNNSGHGILALLIEHCKITKNHSESNGGSGVLLYRAKYNQIEGNTTKSNASDGISLVSDSTVNQTLYNTVRGNTCIQNTLDGIGVEGTSAVDLAYNTLDGNICHSNGAAGVRIQHVAYTAILNNSLSSNAGHGVVMEGDSGTHNIVQGNIVKGSTVRGIHVLDQLSSLIANNVVRENGEEGIRLSACTEVSVRGNFVVSNGTLTNNTYDQISLAANNVQCVVQDNTVRDDGLAKRPRYGIHIAASSVSACVVMGNDIDAGATGAFQDSGTKTFKAGNRTLPNQVWSADLLSIRTIAASALTASAANTNVRTDEVLFTVGGASGASLAVHSGGTVYIFESAVSAKAT